MKDTLILALESSCDETAASIVKNGKEICGEVIASQIDIHNEYGGVVPEIASREHLRSVNIVIDRVLSQSGLGFADLTHIAVTSGPGLVGALLVGVSAAKALSYSLRIPLVAVNHIEGHIYANFLSSDKIEFPIVCLIVSGGHTNLVLIKDHGVYELLGGTRDDAAGEAFDKTARAMGMGYPGGPLIEKAALEGNHEAYVLPRSMMEKGNLDFSFSGIKTAALNIINKSRMKGEAYSRNDLAASLQHTVTDVLAEKAHRALKKTGASGIMLAGGVSANGMLREKIKAVAMAENKAWFYPEMRFCTDNASMIGAAAHRKALRGDYADYKLNADPNLRFEKEIFR